MSSRSIPWLKYAAPPNFYALADRLTPWLWGLAGITVVIGLYIGFFVAPVDYQQGNSYRIMFIHVPTAWMGMFLYLLMAVYGAIFIIWRIRMADVMARAIAPTGALMTFLALWTGALWGAPTWGTFWVWDARLTSTLILFFLFLGYIALHAASDDRDKGGRSASLLAIIGAVNVPIIYFSVNWWYTLHQGASVMRADGPSMAPEMLAALLVMTAAFWIYCAAIVLRRAQAEALEREPGAEWAQAAAAGRLTREQRERAAAAADIGDIGEQQADDSTTTAQQEGRS
ncbi:heme ABC transporter permease [Halorhodospira halochloris]|uniref:Heme exporter protein C n=1 Tax=Halorhodospira halochloris TaxID=1052 RepID=A0A0X8XCM4_HALHR|nr:heme ABC transporter permease [Halorhodospira halochloris]MBK1651988.1 heme ABC transporter permease [Halorhodospira halochloris]MCG5530322.1 heme ABC transporter permease [Halorhodospira halochloris]MCG5547914.1 heme ABC transporter permease [Halorhodospira halochloris]BAU58284.1 cytochrome c-type biogenesis protein CcmC [Halorhodospira halochloris]